MKIIIDTDKKELGAEDVINMGQLYEFLKEHGLLDYGLMGVKSDSPSVFPVKFAPNPLDPPHKITSTGGPITVNHDQKSDFGYQFIDPNKYQTPDIYRNDPRSVGVEDLKNLIDGIQ